MLLEDLRKAIEDMEEIRSLEKDSQDFQRQNKIDNLYVEEVNDNNKIVCCVESTIIIVKFIPSLSLKEQILQLLRDSQKCMEAGLVSESHLKILQRNTKKIREDFIKEWNTFYQSITDKKLHMLIAIKEITIDKNKTGYVINKIKNACVINLENDNKIRQLAEGLSEADEILKELSLEREKEIMDFLDKVADGRATILDITDGIAKWIGERNLGDKFLIGFR